MRETRLWNTLDRWVKTLSGPARGALAGSLLLALAVPLVGCGGGEMDPSPADAAAPAEGPVAPDAVVGSLRALGPPDRVPREIAARLTAPVYGAGEVGGPAPEATRWSIQPETAGELRVTGPDTLSFLPAEGLRPGVRYTFELRQVGGAEGAPREVPPDEGRLEVDVPAFAFVRLAPGRHDPVAGTAEIELVFSAGVRAADVADQLRVSVGGRRLAPKAVVAGDQPDVVRVLLRSPALTADQELQVELAAGVPYAGDPAVKAPAAEATVKLRVGAPIEIRAVLLKEGQSGHYIDVVCHDPEAGGERWYWDPDSYDGWWLSSRCMPEDALARLQLSPEVTGISVSEAPAGFRIYGDFRQGPIELRLDAGLQTVDGGVLRDAFVAPLAVPRRTPRVSFRAKGRYLPRSAWTALQLEHLNLGFAEVTVREIPPENLLFWLTGDEPASARVANVIAKKELWLRSPEDELVSTWVDVSTLAPAAGRGVYEVTVEGGSAKDAVRLLLTDLQLIAKLSRPAEGRPWGESVSAWVRDAHSGGPVRGARVKLVRASGASLGSCDTDGQGGCSIRLPDDALDTAPPVALIASHGADLTFIELEELRIDPDGEVGGVPFQASAEAPYVASVYTDRGVYRPGDTAHVSAILREPGFHAPPAGLRVSVQVFDPQGKEVRRRSVETDANGLVTLPVPFADFATTGKWRAELQVADRSVGAATFSVEEFVPERMKVEGRVTSPSLRFNEPAPVEIEARWLFGGSAEGSRVELACRIEPGSYTPPGSEGYRFGLAYVDSRAPAPLTLGSVEGALGEGGRGSMACPAAARSGAGFGAASLVADVAVFEGESGRTSALTLRAPVHPSELYIGLRPSVDRVDAGAGVIVDGKLVDPEGRAPRGAPAQIDIEIVRLDEEFGWWWDEDEGGSSYQRLLRRGQVERRQVPVQGNRFQFDWTPTSAAGWLIVANSGDARTEVHLEGDGGRYWWSPRESSVDETPRPRRPRPLVLTAPARVEVGDKVEVRLTAPYAGHLLWTVETDRVVRSEWVPVKAGEVVWTFPVSEFSPDLYVTALLLKDPHLESAEAYLPDRAYGVAGVRVNPSQHVRAVKIQAPAEVRPWSKLEVGIDLGPLDAPATATVAVVDEGILQLTRFASPDPIEQLFARRALGVDTYETIGWSLSSAPRGASSRTGGDESGAASGRVQMVKPVALWSGPVTVPREGKVTVPFDLPGYRGELRVMVVTAEGTRTGAATAVVRVKEPILVQTTLPRFLTRGDVAEIPVFVSNVSGQAREIEVAMEVEAFDPLAGVRRSFVPVERMVEVVGGRQGKIQLQDGASGTVAFRLRAVQGPGAVRVRVVARSGNLRSHEELELPIASDMPEDTRTVQLPMSRASELGAVLAAGGWQTGSDTTTIWLTANPYAPALTSLSSLIRYPHGCIEQTTSGTRPLLFVKNLLNGIDRSAAGEGSVDDMVRRGVERVLSMQTPSGGFAYWPGGAQPDGWGTAYATHMLLDAREAGFPVPAEPLEQAIGWLAQAVRSGSGSPGDRGVAYQHYVLAVAQRPDAAAAQAALVQLERQAEAGRGVDAEAALLLRAAVHLSGDRRHEAALRSLSAASPARARVNDGSYYSELRRSALALSVHQQLFGVDPAAEPAAKALAAALAERGARWYTTQELAWGVSALGQRVLRAEVPRMELRAGPDVLAPSFEGAGGERSWTLQGATAATGLTLSGAAGEAWLVLTTRGARAVDDLPVGGRGLSVQRRLHKPDGVALDLDQHSLGDRVFVLVEVTNHTSATVRNLALVDRLPAGWEIENPRLGRGALPDWVDADTLWERDHMSLRDDRIELYGQLRAGETRRVVYGVRAVTGGSFVLPELTVEAMYDPELWARSPAQGLTVKAPWAAFFL